MIETLPFLYFIPNRAEKLIIGSFPCFNGRDYGDFFYSGSGKNHFWKLLSDTLGMPAENKEQKIKLCEEHHIALTDVAYKVERIKGNCSDANLKILEFNTQSIERCLSSGITAIFFTGMFVEKHFKKLYPRLSVPGYLLLSPSPAANIYIGGLPEFKALKQKGIVSTPYDYRLLKYRGLLS